MPRAEENLIPKGQTRGARKQQEDFLAATNPAVGQGAAPPVEVAPAAPSLDRLQFPTEALLDAALAPTSRPDEPITAGLDRRRTQQFEALRAWMPVLRQIAESEDASPALRTLTQQAAAYFERRGRA